MNVSRAVRREMERENARLPVTLQTVHRDAWPARAHDPNRVRVWQSRDWLVQEFTTGDGMAIARLSVHRGTLDGQRWADGVTWDQLQQIKREVGYGDHDAVEIYPADADVVNVANMRHLWIMAAKLPFAWRSSPSPRDDGRGDGGAGKA